MPSPPQTFVLGLTWWHSRWCGDEWWEQMSLHDSTDDSCDDW